MKYLRSLLALVVVAVAVPVGFAAEKASQAGAAAGELRVFTCGHSFHVWLPGWLKEIEALTDIKGHNQVGISGIGGSRVIQHWDLTDERHKAKEVVATGEIDVLTLSPRVAPDEGIDKFAALAVEHNPKVRVTVQENWLPFDRLDSFGDQCYGEEAKRLRDWQDPPLKDPKDKRDTSHFDVPTADQVDRLHGPYFRMMDAYVAALNKKFGKQVLYIVPVGQAVNALRRKVLEGKAPGIAKQSDLFTDRLGHPKPPVQALSGYCYYAVIHHRNPKGLPLLPGLERGHYTQELNLLLQQLAWDAVCRHPLSGVKAAGGR